MIQDPCNNERFRAMILFVRQMLAGQVKGANVISPKKIILNPNMHGFKEATVALRQAGWKRANTNTWQWKHKEPWRNPCANMRNL